MSLYERIVCVFSNTSDENAGHIDHIRHSELPSYMTFERICITPTLSTIFTRNIMSRFNVSIK